jgi:hypothetical protein
LCARHSSLDRLEAAEEEHYKDLREEVLPEPTPSPIGIASDEWKTFSVQQDTEAVDLRKEPALAANFWTKYQPAFDNASESNKTEEASQSKRAARQSDASMDMSHNMSMSSSSFSMSSPTSRTG